MAQYVQPLGRTKRNHPFILERTIQNYCLVKWQVRISNNLPGTLNHSQKSPGETFCQDDFGNAYVMPHYTVTLQNKLNVLGISIEAAQVNILNVSFIV